MTRQQAQQRNWNICQLTGFLSRIKYMIPDDIAKDYIYYDSIQEQADELLRIIADKKTKRFTCSKCNDIGTQKPTRNKQAWQCNFCNTMFTKDSLYIYKDKS